MSAGRQRVILPLQQVQGLELAERRFDKAGILKSVEEGSPRLCPQGSILALSKYQQEKDVEDGGLIGQLRKERSWPKGIPAVSI